MNRDTDPKLGRWQGSAAASRGIEGMVDLQARDGV